MKEFIVRLGWFYYRKKWIFGLVFMFLLAFAFIFYKATKLYSISAYPVFAFLMFEIFCSWLANPVRNYKVADVKAKKALQQLFFIRKYGYFIGKISAMLDESNATHNSKKLGKWLNKFNRYLKINSKALDERFRKEKNIKRILKLNGRLSKLYVELFERL